MKRRMVFIGMFASSLTAMMCQANEDIPATLTISGEIHPSEPCSVSLTSHYMMLGNAAINTLPLQGKTIDPMKTSSVGIIFKGDNCENAKGFKLIGVADKTGTTLTNNLTSENAAKGVGVGVYQYAGVPVALNSAIMPVVPEIYGAFPLYFNLVKLNDEQQTSGPVQASLTVELETL